MIGSLTIDIEDWFHIISVNAPAINTWASLESRIERNVNRLLEMLEEFSVKATFFWLGWAAERHNNLVYKCHTLGHEIASHGYDHQPLINAPLEKFKNSILKTKKILEDITGDRVIGHRAPAWSIRSDDLRLFEIIKEAGYYYDSSLFPFSHYWNFKSHQFHPHAIQTSAGLLFEIPVPTFKFLCFRLSFFGGGYLRLTPKWLINYGIKRISKDHSPLMVYIHPREIDPDHPRLDLGPLGRFRYYVNLTTTISKLRWLCEKNNFVLMRELINLADDTSKFVEKDEYTTVT